VQMKSSTYPLRDNSPSMKTISRGIDRWRKKNKREKRKDVVEVVTFVLLCLGFLSFFIFYLYLLSICLSVNYFYLLCL